ncbi:Crp/Fnr family transcriptional regulator [Paenibacillus agri]|uniref:Crp/Fnr family transcriptional regulator n=1 Tax=Paenibacillus agri TaxID=2744309 RepID=A0A850ESR8_9BACL|nr:Crp/Fnr family transcriptional regulator [Paenibacillus agri]NUU61832.1 Crp/Fnr family transcriptional regulator [Paenibacillus agri]
MLTDIDAIACNIPRMHTILKDCPFEVLREMEIQTFKKNKFYLPQGEMHAFVYIVVSGNVKVYVMNESAKQVTLDIYSCGNFIGEQEAMIHKPYSASIVSISEVTLIKIPDKAFLYWLSKDANFNQIVMASLCEQMYKLTNRTIKYSLDSVRSQIISSLIEESNGQKSMMIQKKTILDSVSSTNRSVYRVLNQLEVEGSIIISGDEIEIVDREKLWIDPERKR